MQWNGILLSYKKELIWVSSDEVDEPRVYYIQWSKSKRITNIIYNAYICNLERFYLQGSKEYADIKDRLLDTKEGGERGMI